MPIIKQIVQEGHQGAVKPIHDCFFSSCLAWNDHPWFTCPGSSPLGTIECLNLPAITGEKRKAPAPPCRGWVKVSMVQLQDWQHGWGGTCDDGPGNSTQGYGSIAMLLHHCPKRGFLARGGNFMHALTHAWLATVYLGLRIEAAKEEGRQLTALD